MGQFRVRTTDWYQTTGVRTPALPLMSYWTSWKNEDRLQNLAQRVIVRVKWDPVKFSRIVASNQQMLANNDGTEALCWIHYLYYFYSSWPPLQSRYNFNFINKETDSERVSNQPRLIMVSDRPGAHTMFVESKTLPLEIVYFCLEIVWWI